MGRARGIDGHAAAVRMRDRDNVIHIREARQQFGFDTVRGVFDRGGDALNCCRDAENIARADAAIGVAIALKRVARERRKWGGTAVKSGS